MAMAAYTVGMSSTSVSTQIASAERRWIGTLSRRRVRIIFLTPINLFPQSQITVDNHPRFLPLCSTRLLFHARFVLFRQQHLLSESGHLLVQSRKSGETISSTKTLEQNFHTRSPSSNRQAVSQLFKVLHGPTSLKSQQRSRNPQKCSQQGFLKLSTQSSLQTSDSTCSNTDHNTPLTSHRSASREQDTQDGRGRGLRLPEEPLATITWRIV